MLALEEGDDWRAMDTFERVKYLKGLWTLGEEQCDIITTIKSF